MSRARELLAALMQASAGGFLSTPPGLDGETGLGVAAIHGVPRPRTWDAVASAHAPDLPGGTATFTVLEDGTVVVEDDLPDGALIELAEALEESLSPPYRAAAIRNQGDVWSAVAERISVVELPGVMEDLVELTVVAGRRTLTLDGARTVQPVAGLDELVEPSTDVVVHAERIDGDRFAVDVVPL